LNTISTAFSLLKQGKDLIPKGEKKQAAEKALGEAEEKFNLAKTKIAKELDYELCRCTFPPQIMLTTSDRHHWKCPKCGSEIDKTPFIKSGNSGKASEWENIQF